MIKQKRKGILFILSSPSGAGKTTICREILQRQKDNISLSLSVTTRKPRKNEIHGQDYSFISQEQFKYMKENNKLLEWAKVFDNYYGSPNENVEKNINQGKDLLFDIDWQGAKKIASKKPDDIVTIFILPPSGEILSQRLRTRASDPENVIKKRMSKSADEISHYHEYNYVIINEDITETVEKVEYILKAEREKKSRQQNLDQFVEKIIKEVSA